VTRELQSRITVISLQIPSLPADVRNFRKSGQRIGGFLAIPRTHRRKAVAKEQVVRRQRAI
jgi:hypothetical protein